MAIENRVKPSARMAEVITQQRKRILIGVVSVLVGIGVVTGAWFGYQHFKPDPNRDLSTDTVAVRTMLSSKTSYEGTWVRESSGLFEVYLPGEKLDTSKEYESMAVVANRYAERKDNLIDAYGVYVSDEQVDIAVDEDPFFILDTVRDSVLGDISKACACGNPSGAYDIEYLQLDDGRIAMKLTGDVQMTAMLKSSPEDEEPKQENVIYPMIAYVTIEKGTPVAVWCTYDSFDKTASDTSATKLLEVANTVWNTKPTEQEVASLENVEIDADALEG